MAYGRGIFYIASGVDYYNQALISAKSAKKRMPGTRTAIITDQDKDDDIFDTIINVDEMEGTFYDKPKYISSTPFKKTLFVDTDTYFSQSINELWDILEYYNLAATHGVHRRYESPLPIHIPEYSTGVLLFDSSPSVTDLFDIWESNYGTLGEDTKGDERGIVDQDSFRYALFQKEIKDGDIDFLTLAPEYQVIVGYGNRGFLRGPAKILHGDPGRYDFEDLSKKLNEATNSPGFDKRVYYPTGWPLNRYVVKSTGPKSNSMTSKSIYILNRHGVKKLIKAGFKKTVRTLVPDKISNSILLNQK